MKIKSSLLTAVGALALFVLVAFPSSSVPAAGHCYDVDIYYEYGGPTGLLVDMDCAFPFGAIIFYTTDGTSPTHSGGTPTGSTLVYYGQIPQAYGTRTHYKAIAYKAGYGDSLHVVDVPIANPPD
jgi:hypothetical protein